MRLFGRQVASILSVYIIVAFALAGPMHAAIPHNDSESATEAAASCDALYGHGHCPEPTGDTEDSHPSAQFASIHSVLGIEGKKSIHGTPQVIVLAYFSGISDTTIHISSPTVRVTVGKSERLLSRGVLAYRRFG